MASFTASNTLDVVGAQVITGGLAIGQTTEVASGLTVAAGGINVTGGSLSLTGIAGANAGARWVGSTSSGAPTSGSFNVGDWVVDKSGKIWIYATGNTWTSGGGGGTIANALTIGTGLSGTSFDGSTPVTISLANTAVTPASYTNANITVDAQGRITAAANGTGGASLSVANTWTATQTFTAPLVVGAGRTQSAQAAADIQGQLRASQYIIGNPISGSSITYGAVTSNNLLPPPTFHNGTGALTSVGTVATETSPHCVAVDPTGRFVFVTNYGTSTVQSYTINQFTGALTSVGAISSTTNPESFVVDPTGRFAFVTGGSNFISIYTINQSTGALTSAGVAAAGFGFKCGAFDPTGKFAFLTNVTNNTVQTFTVNQLTGALTSVGTAATGTSPQGVAVDPTGRFVFVGHYNDSIVQTYTITQSTGALTSVGTVATGLCPLSVVADPTGRFVFVVNNSSNTVQAYTINQSTGALTNVGAVTTGSVPRSVAVDPTGRFAFVINYYNNTVRIFTINQLTGALTSVGTAATGYAPMSVAVDPTGRFAFVTNFGDANLQAYRINNFAANSGTFIDVLDVKGILSISGSTSGSITFTAPASAGSATYTLPSADGTTGQMLSTNGSGTLSWATAGSGGTSAQPLDADLTAIAGLAGTSGLLKKTAADTWSLDTSTYLTGNQSIIVSGDASGSGTTAITLTLATTGVSASTYRSVTVDTKGRVTAGTNPTTLTGYGITDAQPLDADLTAIAGLAGTSGLLKKTAADTWSLDTSTYLTGNQSIIVSGDASGSGTTAITLTLATTGVSASTYRSVTVDTKGRVTAGTNPTSLSGYGITDAQPLDADLTAIAGLAETAGLLKKTAADTWSLDTSTYLTGNQSISVTGDASGSGTTAITLTLANTAVTPASYTNANITVDAQGRITAASNGTGGSGGSTIYSKTYNIIGPVLVQTSPRWSPPANITITTAYASCSVAPTTGALVFTLRENATVIGTLTIAQNQYVSSIVTITIASTSSDAIYIDTVSSNGASDASITLYYTQP